ncbi:MAG TPA: F0F1 ATP synthase subunit delta [Candidatus Saccharimonadales bacterium]|nr:F0F1 ATP synthase subunit delta [Candidatus Saccharimonadales bacterium]
MKARRPRIAQVIADQTLKSGVSKRLSREVAAYLLSEHRTGELDSIVRDVQADWAAAGQVEVIASSAHPLTAAVRADITRQIKRLYPQAKRVIVTEVRDPDVIGGVRLNLADRQLDLSVEAKLNKFKQLTTAANVERK